jgi:hypothetical protein
MYVVVLYKLILGWTAQEKSVVDADEQTQESIEVHASPKMETIQPPVKMLFFTLCSSTGHSLS